MKSPELCIVVNVETRITVKYEVINSNDNCSLYNWYNGNNANIYFCRSGRYKKIMTLTSLHCPGML